MHMEEFYLKSILKRRKAKVKELPQKDLPPWDAFKCYPTKLQTGSMQDKRYVNIIARIVKILVYSFLLVVTLVLGVVSKISILFATSQLREEKALFYCTQSSAGKGHPIAKLSQEGHVIWTWCILFIYIVPEFFGVFRTIRYYLFKRKRKLATKISILILLLTETLNTVGQSLLVFLVLPSLDLIQAAFLLNCLCFVPALLNILSRNVEQQDISKSKFILLLITDVFSLIVQVSGTFLWFLIDNYSQRQNIWIFPVAIILSSCRWWHNYVSIHSHIGIIRFLAKVKIDLMSSTCILQGYISIWRCLVFFACMLGISVWKGIAVEIFFKNFLGGRYNVEIINATDIQLLRVVTYDVGNVSISTNTSTQFYILLLQTISSLFLYQLAKFSYKTHMHQFGFALPINLITTGTVITLLMLYSTQPGNVCIFNNIFSNYLLVRETKYNDTLDLLLSWHVWLWFAWIFTQLWITIHVWSAKCERLACAEQIFSMPTYDAFMIDQSLPLNKQKYSVNNYVDENDSEETIQKDIINMTSVKRSDYITKIYACATMWHEERDEMNELVGSILRLDKDQCAMRVTQKYYKIYLGDYYELETHVFFDDAFRCMHGCSGTCEHDENETQVNQYVMTLVETVQKNIENMCMHSTAPTKYPTPYGGMLLWILPGKTKLVVHLKDKNKIRHRKRWSQVMYMYYFLGYRLMSLPINVDRKEVIAENTYILTLDGDIDFHPSAVKVLVDLMKKDKDLGAACGRIHPVGNGPMIWFQKFEYAIGHWLQKSTEHVIGSVLCSPGCFSLFRAKALMQHNVMAKYATTSTEPRHYVQYDQGEDRWLCTLVLQVGCRVEYSAASDAYTHAPESFKDFYIQRRRWIPSTVANIFDLLSTSKETRKINDDISWLYIVYQWILMGSTIFGPGTIFLMLVGAFVAAFRIDNWSSFLYNLIPISIFIVICFTCKERIQLLAATIISAIYGLVMVVVLVGIMLQIAEDGWYSPSSLLFFIVAAQLIIAGLLHPQEWICLFCGIIYYITVPSMYMFLIVFSIFNLHNVSWGTRESKTFAKNQNENYMNKNTSKHDKRIGKWDKRKGDDHGSIEFSLAGFFRCLFCTHNESSKEDKRLDDINNSVNQIKARLDMFEREINNEISTNQSTNLNTDKSTECYDESMLGVFESHIEVPINVTNSRNHSYKDTDSENEFLSQISTNSSHEHSSFLISPYWLQDERMRMGEVDFLSNSEEEFWKGLIEKYLRPIENDEEKQYKIASGLKNMRNEYLLKFFMINALFVLIVFLMQLNKETLHLQWPLGVKYNISYDSERKEVHLKKEYLRLEPIGCLFIVGFIIILFIQFMAMLVHRFNTFIHMLANANLNLSCCNKVRYSTDDQVFERHADDIIRELQRVTDDDITNEFRRLTLTSAGRRKTVRELAEVSHRPSKTVDNFERLFRRKLDESAVFGLSHIAFSGLPRNVLSAFQRRRSTILAERRRSQPQEINPYSAYENHRDNVEESGMYNTHNDAEGKRRLENENCVYENPAFKRGDDDL